MNNYTVYKHIFPNGKIYVGITCQKPERRWSNGNGYSRQKLLYNAITKYKWHNIEHKILYTYLTKEEAEQKEIELIKDYKCNQKKYGYNLNDGGNCANSLSQESRKKVGDAHRGIKFTDERKDKIRKAITGIKRSEETRKKISESEKGNKYRLGAKLSQETKNKISKSNIEAKKKYNYWVGKTHTEETKEKIRQYHLGKIASQREITQYTVDNKKIKNYKSILIASKETNINKANICSCCKGKLKTAGGYIWKYKEE